MRFLLVGLRECCPSMFPAPQQTRSGRHIQPIFRRPASMANDRSNDAAPRSYDRFDARPRRLDMTTTASDSPRHRREPARRPAATARLLSRRRRSDRADRRARARLSCRAISRSCRRRWPAISCASASSIPSRARCSRRRRRATGSCRRSATTSTSAPTCRATGCSATASWSTSLRSCARIGATTWSASRSAARSRSRRR